MVALALLGILPGRLLAQSVTGTVVRPEGPDSTPVGDVRVVLHRVGSDQQGPIDSMVTGPDGRFRFRFVPDSALHLLSARYGGIEYFSAPLERDSTGPQTVRLVVHDTSSRAPVAVSARHLVIPRAGADGTREVLDLVQLDNRGTLTRVAPDSAGASWAGPLPAPSEGLELGESDVSPDAVTRRGDSVIVSAPIAPGEKQLALQYHLPGGRGRIDVPVGSSPVSLNVLLEEPGASVEASGLAPADSQLIEGRSFRRWSGNVPAGSTVRISLPAGPPKTTPILAAMVGAVALALAFVAWRVIPRPPAGGTDHLVGALAALDARYQGREGEVPPEEWAGYLDRRRRLKAELRSALARESGSR
jgi:hypothetical protein